MQDVREQIPDAPTYSTVRAMLRMLEEKGFLQHQQDGLKYVYFSSVPRQAAGLAAHGFRLGDDIHFVLPLHSDRAGNDGFLAPGLDMTLYRNGQRFLSADASSRQHGGDLKIPADRARYRLEASGTQSFVGLSTRINAAWTFDSEHTEERTSLPLMTVKFKPDLNARGQARRRHLFLMPVTIVDAGSDHSSMVRDLDLEISFDDGATWNRVPAWCAGKQWLALVYHPVNASHVSLRAVARDFEGSQVEQTVIRAYGVTDRRD